jgi:hypothetical protein
VETGADDGADGSFSLNLFVRYFAWSDRWLERRGRRPARSAGQRLTRAENDETGGHAAAAFMFGVECEGV